MKIEFELTEEEFWNKLRVIVREELEDLYNTKEPENKEIVRKSTVTATEPEVIDTARYSTTETCKILSLCRATVLRYTNQGALRCGIRKSNGRKFYTGSDIKKFWKAQY
ncbi:MAG: helix-turn-helix domain-containing protein [Prolixibacteraceae bacterium]|nr:helix-turn-helix domain-containing protein [Prolixibacteraceae bacterium]